MTVEVFVKLIFYFCLMFVYREIALPLFEPPPLKGGPDLLLIGIIFVVDAAINIVSRYRVINLNIRRQIILAKHRLSLILRRYHLLPIVRYDHGVDLDVELFIRLFQVLVVVLGQLHGPEVL